MKQAKPWRKLDNAAKIFPPTSTGKDTKVFRFSCELYEKVDKEILQRALDRTVERFSFYRSVIKKGLFWYYFEESGIKPVVTEENKPPCSPIYNVNKKELLFRVTYYRCRINLGVFHALSDGMGAMQFLRTLVMYYISEKHAGDFLDHLPAVDYDASKTQIANDSFTRYHDKVKIRRSKEPKAHRLRGERLYENRMRIIEGLVSVASIRQVSKRYEVTITEFLVAVLIWSIHENMTLQEEKRPVVITVPVNLRKYFPSESSRNFFTVINIDHDFRKQGKSLCEVIDHVRERFREQLTLENLRNKMNLLTSLEHNIPAKLVPLAIKIPFMKIGNWVAEQAVTASFSNIGVVDMPKELEPYVRLFDVFSSTGRQQICLCSYLDNMMISFTSPFVSTDIQRCFFRTLAENGVAVKIGANKLDTE